MKIKEVNYFGIDHAKAEKKFEGQLKYVRTFTVCGTAWAVYRNSKPNRKKGHKDYMLLTFPPFSEGAVISGVSHQKMTRHRRQHAIHCLKCDTVIYSVTTHHSHECECGSCSVDGGKDYLRTERGPKSKLVILDLITGKLVDKSKCKR